MNIITRFIKLVSNLKEGSSNDVLGAYPESVHVPAMPERRYLKTSRIMAIASIISMCGTIILGCILFYLAPQLSIKPRIVVLNRYDDIVQPIEGFTSRIPAFTLMTEKYVTDYVKLRNSVTPDLNVMNEQWGPESLFNIMSTADTYALNMQERARALEEIRKSGLKRDVKILWAERLNNRGITNWRVRYETTDTFTDGRPPEHDSWYATMTVGYAPRRISQAYKMQNPAGFIVYSYVTSKAADAPEDAERFIFEK